MRTYELSVCVDGERSAHHPDGYMYDRCTKRVVSIGEGGDIVVVGPRDFHLLPKDGWYHERGCPCHECRR